jgi:vitellogenic carboxypeptidase-like protein
MNFKSQQYEYETAPVMYWVEGGSGLTGMFEVFCGNGPFEVDKSVNLHLKSQPWSLTHSMIYLDNPVGSGMNLSLRLPNLSITLT